MTYWVKNERTGEIYKGKAEKWSWNVVPFGFKLYNPYSKRTIIGWNAYKADMQRSYEKKVIKK